MSVDLYLPQAEPCTFCGRAMHYAMAVGYSLGLFKFHTHSKKILCDDNAIDIRKVVPE